MANPYSVETWAFRSHFSFRWKEKHSEILPRFIATPLGKKKSKEKMLGWVNQAFFIVDVGITTSRAVRLLQIAELLFGAIWKRTLLQGKT